MNQPDTPNDDDALLKKRLDDICEGLSEAIDREVEALRREGLPIYVSENGKIVDLNAAASSPD